jgi:hypothetical protein
MKRHKAGVGGANRRGGARSREFHLPETRRVWKAQKSCRKAANLQKKSCHGGSATALRACAIRLVWVLALGAVPTASTQTALSADSQSLTNPDVPALDDRPEARPMNPRIGLRIYNYAHISQALLVRAEGEAAAIFHRAGVETDWVDCPLSAAELDRFPGCRQPMSSSDFALRILPDAMTSKSPASGDALGFALPCATADTGCYANIFYDRVASSATEGELSAYQILGHAMSHEIGHLLLGSDSHSRTGIMRAHWNPKDLRMMAKSSLDFTPAQRELIRAALQRRMARPTSHTPRQSSADGWPPLTLLRTLDCRDQERLGVAGGFFSSL